MLVCKPDIGRNGNGVLQGAEKLGPVQSSVAKLSRQRLVSESVRLAQHDVSPDSRGLSTCLTISASPMGVLKSTSLSTRWTEILMGRPPMIKSPAVSSVIAVQGFARVRYDICAFWYNVVLARITHHEFLHCVGRFGGCHKFLDLRRQQIAARGADLEVTEEVRKAPLLEEGLRGLGMFRKFRKFRV